jgi:NAD(P)-dependent dehydrogenase (short-subunit alcohol dehydrogenase family)
MHSERTIQVLVTGAGGPLGAAVCHEFLRAGSTVAAVERRASAATRQLQAQYGERLQPVEGDLAQPAAARQAVEEAARRLGGLGVVCNVAGGFEMGAFPSIPPEQVERMLSVNYRTAFYTTQAAVPLLRQAGRGKIVFVGSRAALDGGPHKLAYAAAKSAVHCVHCLSRGLAAELLSDGIQVNAIVPSTIDTPANRAAMPEADPALWPKPEAIARIVRWLCSSEAELISGAEIPVYGRS